MLNGGVKLLKNVYARFFTDLGIMMHQRGSRITGNKYYNENNTDHKTFFPIEGHKITGKNSKVATSSFLLGSIQLQDNNIVGIRSALYANAQPIRVGKNSILGDSVSVSTQILSNDQIGSVNIGENVLIDDRSVLKCCQIGDNVLIGEQAQIQEGAKVHDNVIIENGTIVNRLQIIPENTVWAGQPARKVRDLSAEDKDLIQQKLDDKRQAYELLNQTQIFTEI